jgi:hypothetical protein
MRTPVEFEWDEAKRSANFEKHGIDFPDLGSAFEDDRAIHVEDIRADYGEQRIIMLARCFEVILNIVYTPRGNRIRLISARLCNSKERSRYDNR